MVIKDNNKDNNNTKMSTERFPQEYTRNLGFINDLIKSAFTYATTKNVPIDSVTITYHSQHGELKQEYTMQILPIKKRQLPRSRSSSSE